MRIAGLGVLLALGSVAVPARAQFSDGQPLRTNNYTIDLFQGPVLASSRVIGLAGAFVAMAEGVEGDSQNPAAPAVRVPYSRNHFDYDLGVSVTLPATIEGTDFFNSGRRTRLPGADQSGFVFLGLALNLQLGAWGLGLTTDLQTYSLQRSKNATTMQNQDKMVSEIGVGHVQLAHGFADNQLVIGVGNRTAGLDVNNESALGNTNRSLFSTVGAGLEFGFVWKPNNQRFRLGGAFRSAVTTQASPENQFTVLYAGDPDNELWLPQQVSLPWDLNMGVAIQFGPRPLNPPFFDPTALLRRVHRYLEWRARERERRRAYALAQASQQGRDATQEAHAVDAELSMEAALDQEYLERAERDVDEDLRRRYLELQRFHVLLTASLLITGPVDRGVGVESFLEREVQRSGERVSISPRGALESELIPHWTRVRMGSYFEPTRFSYGSSHSRTHATFGLDEKLFPFDVFGLFAEGTEWRLSGAVDFARDYFGWGVALGVWH